MATRAETLLKQLRENVDDWYADKTSHEQFRARQSGVWAAIQAAGPVVHEAVLSAIRERLVLVSRQGVA